VKPVIVIHIDALRREYFSCWLLGELFKERGYSVVLSSRISTHLLLKIITPDVLILSHVFGLRQSDLIKLRKKDCRIYVNEVEGIVFDELGVSTTYPDDIEYGLFKDIFVWNTWTRDWMLKNRMVEEDQVKVVGSIRNSLLDSKPSPTLRKIGFLSRFEIINVFDRRHNFSNLLTINPESKLEDWYIDRCAIDSESFVLTKELIKKLIASGVAVSIRVHPNEDISSYDLLIDTFGPALEIDKSYDINEWLRDIAVIVGPLSTAFVEPLLQNKPVVSLDGLQSYHYRDKDRFKTVLGQLSKYVYLPHSLDEALDLCMNVDKPYCDIRNIDVFFNDMYAFDSCDDSILALVNAVDADFNGSKMEGHKFSTPMVFFVKYFLDLLQVIRGSFSVHPIYNFKTRLRNIRNYSFNLFLHFPSKFMLDYKKDYLNKVNKNKRL
jgi:surface carbohydrate biosynthesis protein